MPRSKLFLTALVLAVTLIWGSAIRDAAPIQGGDAAFPVAVAADGGAHLPTFWTRGRPASPWRSEEPLELLHVERATELEEESVGVMLGIISPTGLALGLADLGLLESWSSSRTIPGKPASHLLPILRC
jgi:hypothetical protein